MLKFNNDGLLKFNNDGLLEFCHECPICARYPNKNVSEQCVTCGYSRAELYFTESRADAMNVNFIASGEEGMLSTMQKVTLHISEMHISSDEPDTMVLRDIDINDDIRSIAKLNDHMVELIVIPTNIRRRDVVDDDEVYK